MESSLFHVPDPKRSVVIRVMQIWFMLGLGLGLDDVLGSLQPIPPGLHVVN